ncbi:MAG: methionine--tRNA ligase [Patescibacteria group bacterium]
MATIEELKKIELCVGKVIAAERIEGSEKLLKLSVDLGARGTRQIIAGIGRAYAPEALVGREIAVAAGLEPRTIMGHESQGMLLAASGEGGEPVLLAVEKEVPPGTEIR